MNITKLSTQEEIRESIRVFLYDENKNIINYKREDEYSTTVESGFEDLNLKKDATKISLYQTCEYIELYNNKKYKVVERSLQPCCPVCLYLILKEVE